MLLDNTDSLSTFSEWQKFFKMLTPADVGAAWYEAHNERLKAHSEVNFQLAVIDRLFEIGCMSTAVTDAQRSATLQLAETIIVGLRERFANQPVIVARIDGAIENARNFYATYGGLEGRELMFARGLVDEWGAELDPPPTVSSISVPDRGG